MEHILLSGYDQPRLGKNPGISSKTQPSGYNWIKPGFNRLWIKPCENAQPNFRFELKLKPNFSITVELMLKTHFSIAAELKLKPHFSITAELKLKPYFYIIFLSLSKGGGIRPQSDKNHFFKPSLNTLLLKM